MQRSDKKKFTVRSCACIGKFCLSNIHFCVSLSINFRFWCDAFDGVLIARLFVFRCVHGLVKEARFHLRVQARSGAYNVTKFYFSNY